LPAAWFAARRARSKLVYDARELETGRNFSGSNIPKVFQRYWAIPEQLFIRRADATITTCQSYANELVRLYRIPAPWIVRNCAERYPSGKSNRLRDELGIQDSDRIVLYQGRIAVGRGIESLFKAIQPLPRVVAVALGDGPSLGDLRDRLRRGEWQRVYLPGKVQLKELLSYSTSADIGSVLIEDICLSYRLSLPNKLFEYIQAELPVIGSNLPEIAGVIREHEIGEVISMENIPDITRAINRLIDDPLHYQKIRLNLSRAAQIYNWENESQKLLQAYSSIG
jgi:glycosyltransferase involved in cell wall biosynthesis